MHDIVDLEDRGLPTVFVSTVEFIDGAEAQATALGTTPSAVYVEHPIQDRTDDEMIAYADAAFDDIVAAVTSGD